MSPSSDNSAAALVTAVPEYSDSERHLLLSVAHRSIEAVLHSQPLDLTPPNKHLAEPRGAFTTLHINGNLHGCIGYVIPSGPLYRTIAETAKGAAFDDPRFEAITPEEAARLKVEISVLSRLTPIRPEDVVVGKHGLLITSGTRRGLLLPQVPLEWGWNRETFLSQTCMKAGLPPMAWLQGAEVQAFTAEVFGEE